ncbi:hypothetical protein RhiirA5_447197 [Rhizophagus irregularis]|uniref:Uncharacterized protein n=1 Tax=Rhizophagus irregularis TaxID=588596 RepID=A0A2N0NBA9_9GLOM|nr:hypothetical protein RhiirA5_447197 [Rhizophagus irregularis]
MWLNYVIKDGEVKKVLRDFIINRIKGFVDKEIIPKSIDVDKFNFEGGFKSIKNEKKAYALA